jgi:hypothetical protein
MRETPSKMTGVGIKTAHDNTLRKALMFTLSPAVWQAYNR